MNCRDFLGRILEAHGGVAFWHRLSALEAEVSASGFLFWAKRRPVLDHVRVTAYTQAPHFIFHDYPVQGQSAELFGEEVLRIVDGQGKVVAERSRPRQAFREFSRLVRWDDLDFVYFGGYATWNYMLTPFIFLRNGFEFELMDDEACLDSAGFALRVTFPPDIPTHCRTQTFCFDGSGYLRRLDYTAEVVGPWAHAAHMCENYRNFSGYQTPTRRRVFPLLWGHKPVPFPILVALDIHDLRPVFYEGSS